MVFILLSQTPWEEIANTQQKIPPPYPIPQLASLAGISLCWPDNQALLRLGRIVARRLLD